MTTASGRVPSTLDRAVWEREMRRLRTAARALGAILIALLARAVTAGLTATLDITAIVIGTLLLAALWLRRHGQSLQPDDHTPNRAPVGRGRPNERATGR
jgi:hypothetical protein